MNKQSAAFLGSIIFLAVTLFGYYWLWNQAQVKTQESNVIVPENLKPVDILNIKQQAQDILDDLSKVSDMPISKPAAENIGRPNPFKGV